MTPDPHFTLILAPVVLSTEHLRIAGLVGPTGSETVLMIYLQKPLRATLLFGDGIGVLAALLHLHDVLCGLLGKRACKTGRSKNKATVFSES